MKKTDALKRILEEQKEIDKDNFEREVRNLVYAIQEKSDELRRLKKELTELTFEESPIPDVVDCMDE